MTIDFPLAWALVIAFALTMYVILDGFDLGVGMLLLSVREEGDRDLMVRSIAPVWDGNETWLVLVGVSLLGGFPAAYGVALPAFYLPIVVMLLCMALRGTAFEFRFQTRRSRWAWDAAFCAGSWGAALCQGLIVGGLLTGVAVRDQAFAGGQFDWLRPLGFFTACAVSLAYALLGATWLIFRTTGTLAALSRTRARAAVMGLMVVLSAIVILLPRIAPLAMEYSTMWNLSTAALLLGVVIGFGLLLLTSLRRKGDRLPFVWAVTLVLVIEAAFVSTIWPFVIPYELDFRQAASASRSQAVLLTGAIFILPFVLLYSAYSYFVFRGKVIVETEDEAPQAISGPAI